MHPANINLIELRNIASPAINFVAYLLRVSIALCLIFVDVTGRRAVVRWGEKVIFACRFISSHLIITDLEIRD
jgi:hypothetical protein